MVAYFDRTLHRVDALSDYPDRVGQTLGTNWLLTGIDSRSGLTPQEQRQLSTGGDTGPAHTDSIMVVHIPRSGRATVVSIPRDSSVPIPGHGRDKINAALAIGGPKLLVQTLETATGLHIDHYAQIGFDGFDKVVDAVGGIDMCLPQAMDDPLAGVNLSAGCQHLNGIQALGFVRSRATPTADLARMANQRAFMSALLHKMISPGTYLNPWRLWSVGYQGTRSLTVDKGDHIWDFYGLATALGSNPVTTTVPIGGFADVSGVGNVLLWDKSKASTFFDTIANDQPIPDDLITAK